ncbi:hypothetical protein [Marimonas lutisalis]|uniref:hypothetical protein n=1 Tax=Marimonas lutisalis TaxID=2545756 RepID=UPI0010F9655E|nr:hypothetical protein [Marimonas lutisalis]
MGEQSFLQDAVEELEHARDIAAAARELVTQNGGCWNNELAQKSDILFEIHLFGVVGIGLGTEGAARNWLENAKAEINALVDTV